MSFTSLKARLSCATLLQYVRAVILLALEYSQRNGGMEFFNRRAVSRKYPMPVFAFRNTRLYPQNSNADLVSPRLEARVFALDRMTSEYLQRERRALHSGVVRHHVALEAEAVA